MPPGNLYPFTRSSYGNYQWFQSQVGRQIPDYGPEPKRWPRDKVEAMHDLINRGIQQVYYPDSVLGKPFKWSWLTGEFEIVLAADKDRYTLEPDFCGMLGKLYFSNADNVVGVVDKVGYDSILANQMLSTSTGFPVEYAEVQMASDGTQAQQMRLIFWPMPDASYTLRGVVDIVPPDLTEANPWPLGGRAMTETYLASIESLLDPKKQDQLKSRLVAAISVDLSRHSGENLGKMTNGGELWGASHVPVRSLRLGTVSYE